MPRPAPRSFDHHDEPDGVFGSALGLVAARPFDTIAALLATACTVMILVNALALQQGKAPVVAPEPRREAAHAAPAPAPQPKAAPVHSDLVAQVQTALAERNLYDGVVDGLMGQGTSVAVRAFEKSQNMPQTGEATEKILAALLTAPMGRPEPARAASRPAPAAAPAASAAGLSTGSTAPDGARLMAVQKALARIGYGPVTIDGKMGLETRNAIRSFEKDRGMAETGEPSPAVIRALQAMTGAPIN